MLVSRNIIKMKDSYMLTIPIDWVREQELEKGDKVEISELPDGSLKIAKRK
jgi:phosphate uptake regulator